MKRLLGLVVAGLLLTGCGGESAPAAPQDSVTQADLQTCIDALDAANAGFRDLAAQVQTVQTALNEAFSGSMSQAQSTLAQVERVDSSTYKALEADCRDG